MHGDRSEALLIAGSVENAAVQKDLGRQAVNCEVPAL